MTTWSAPGGGPSGGPAPDVRLPDTVPVAAGSATVLPVVVTNTADEPRRLSVIPIGVDQGWLPGPVVTRVLRPGESDTVALRIEPATGTLPARYPLAVTVQSLVPGSERAAPGPAGIGESTLVVNARAELQLEVTPEQSRIVRGQRIRVVLRNSGPVEVATDLEGEATKGLEVRLRRRAVRVGQGEEVRLRGRLVATRPRLFGAGVQHSWTVTATAPDVVRRARGTVQQRAVLGPTWVKGAALLAVCAVWITAALVAIPLLAERFGGADDVVTVTGPGDGSEDGDGADGGSGADDGAGDEGGASDVTVTRAKSPATPKGLQLNGTVSAEDPDGVTVTLEPTSLVDEEVQDAQPVGDTVALAGYGKTTRLALVAPEPDDVPRSRSATTGDDGTWSFPEVAAPGYYLLTFSKPGYATERYVVDAATADATEPLEVELEPGDGALSGTVTGPKGRVGAATVTITDGTSTITTSTSSRGDVGRWSVAGLATPATYLVQVSSYGLGTESRLVDLGAGDTGRADLQLRPGVGALTGTVTRAGENRGTDGLGGVLVTVTAEDGTTRQVTTETPDAFQGDYRMAGLPVPGTYTVTFTADGYQTETSEVRFGDGQSLEALDIALVPSTGVVRGKVRERGTGKVIGGAGLTLANGTFTYKTTSTDDGTLQFDGVEPGVYQLTTEFFRYDTEVLTVRVRAGERTTVNPRIGRRPGGVLDASATIRGSAVDKFSGDAVDCNAAAMCTATTVEEDGDRHTTTFLGEDEYELPPVPDEEGDVQAGLEPGLYTVTVSAPGYESASVKVEVPLGAEAVAPVAELTKLPTVTGNLLATSGTPKAFDHDDDPNTPPVPPRTCVWAVPVGEVVPADLDCVAASDSGDTCEATAPAVCTWVPGLNPYTLELPAPGPYWLIASLTDPAYKPTPAIPINVSPGGTALQNLLFVRKAQVNVVTYTPDAVGLARIRAGVPVSIKHVNGDEVDLYDDPIPSGPDGRVEFSALTAGTYTVTASLDDYRAVSATVTVEDSQEQTAHLTLGDLSALPFFAQVVTDGGHAVDEATVSVTAPIDFVGTAPRYHTWSATTEVAGADNDGCVVFYDDEDDGPGGRPPFPAMAPCDARFHDPVSGPGMDAVELADFATSRAQRIRVTAPGYESLDVIDLDLVSVKSVFLHPKAVGFASSLTSETRPGVEPSYEDVRFTVTSSTTSTGSITVTADADGAIGWEDSRYTAGLIRPGEYTLTAHLDGYVSEPVTFTCPVVADCEPQGPLLRQLGSLTVRAVDGTGDAAEPVEDVWVTLYNGSRVVSGPTRSAVDGNEVSFDGLLPGAAPDYPTAYTVRVQGAGYSFDKETHSLACSLPVPDPPPFPVPEPRPDVVVKPGENTTCTVDLAALGTITGTVQGVLAAPPAQTPFRDLSGASVTATRCTRVVPAQGGADPVPAYCAAVDTSARFSATSLADGTFRISGTNSTEGLRPGAWLVRAQEPGWSTAPVSADPEERLGELVEVGPGVVSENIQLHVDPVDFTVEVRDQTGRAVTGLAVELQRNGVTVRDDEQPTGVPGQYRFADAIPGPYTVLVTGTGVQRTTQQVEIRVGGEGQLVPVPVTRAANNLAGTVRASDASAVAGAEVTLHECTSASECSSAVAEGTDGQPLVRTTSTTGTFELRTVPDGLFRVRVHKKKYDDALGGPLLFDHTLAPIPPLAVTLQKILRPVQVDVATNPAGGDLTGAQVRLVPTDSSEPTLGPQPLAGTGVAFPQVAYGCWNVQLDLPARHYGRVSLPAPVPHPDGDCSGHVVVAGSPGQSRLQTTATVTETRVDLRVTATAIAGHQAPLDARVLLPGFPAEVVAVGSGVSVYLPPGTHDISASAVGLDAGEQPFWKGDSEQLAITAGAAPKTVSLELVEETGELAVKTVLADTTTAVRGRLTLAPGTGQSASVPSGYAAGVATTGTFTFDLPSGPWTITITTTDGRTVTVPDVSVSALVGEVTIEVPPPPP